MEINGVEVDFQISNIEHAERMEKALQTMAQEENKISEMGNVKMSVMLTKMIDVFKNFFREVTGKDVLADCKDFMQAKQVYSEFLAEVAKQKESVLAPFSLQRIK